MVVRPIEVGEGAGSKELVISVDGSTRSAEVDVDKVVEVMPGGAPVPKVVVTDAPLPGRNNRLDICAVVYSYVLGS